MLKYELQKITFQKVGLLLITVLWLVTQMIFGNSLNKKWDSMIHTKEWSSVSEELKNRTSTQALEWLMKEEDELIELSIDDIFLYWEKTDYHHIIQQKLDRYRYLNDYAGYIQQVLEQAEAMEHSPLRKNQGNFIIENTRKTKQAFEPFAEKKLSVDAPMYLADVLGDKVGMMLLVVQIVILAICVFGAEQNAEKKMLLTMQYRGRVPVAVSKSICVCIGSILFVCMMYGGFLLQASSKINSVCDWSAPIQSLAEWKRCTWDVSCLQFLLLFLIYKILVIILNGLLASLCICLLKGESGIVLFGIIWFLCIVIRVYFPETVEWLWIKNSNLALWTDTWEWMHQYRNIALFDHAVSRESCFYVGMTIGIPLCLIAVIVIFPKSWQPFEMTYLIQLKRKAGKIAADTAKTTSFFFHHTYQMFLYKRRYFLVLATLLVIYFIPSLHGKQTSYDLIRATYESYLRTIHGIYTEDTRIFLEQEEAHLNGTDGYAESLAEEQKKGILSTEEYDTLMYKFQQEVRQKQDGFNQVARQWDFVRRVEESGIGVPGFFHQVLSEEMFLIKQKDYFLIGLLTCFIILFTAPYSKIEASNEDLIATTQYGRKKRLFVRLSYNMGITLAISAGIYLVWYRTLLNHYPEQDYRISAACLEMFANLDPTITISQVMIVSGIAKIIGCVLVAVLVTLLSVRKMDSVSYYSLLAAILIVPILLGTLHVPVQMVSFVGFFQIEVLLSRSLWGSVGYLVIWSVAVIGFCVYTFWRVQHMGEGIERKRKGRNMHG